MIYQLGTRSKFDTTNNVLIYSREDVTWDTFLCDTRPYDDKILFTVCELGYSKYFIHVYKGNCEIIKVKNCWHVYDTLVALTSVNENIARLINIDGLSDDEIFANMVVLRDYLCKFVDYINAFSDSYKYIMPKSANNFN